MGLSRSETPNDEVPYADSVNYWKTSTSAPGTWLERAASEIERAGGKVVGHAFGSDTTSGYPAYMLMFELGGESFRVVWPVLTPKKPKDELAARRQATTCLFYDIKARCVSAKVMGARLALFAYLQLPDGRTAGQVAMPELERAIPKLLSGERP